MGLPSEFNKLRKGNQEIIFWKNNYLVPLIYLIPRVITHIKRSSSKGVLAVVSFTILAFCCLLAFSSNIKKRTSYLPLLTIEPLTIQVNVSLWETAHNLYLVQVISIAQFWHCNFHPWNVNCY